MSAARPIVTVITLRGKRGRQFCSSDACRGGAGAGLSGSRRCRLSGLGRWLRRAVTADRLVYLGSGFAEDARQAAQGGRDVRSRGCRDLLRRVADGVACLLGALRDLLAEVARSDLAERGVRLPRHLVDSRPDLIQALLVRRVIGRGLRPRREGRSQLPHARHDVVPCFGGGGAVRPGFGARRRRRVLGLIRHGRPPSDRTGQNSHPSSRSNTTPTRARNAHGSKISSSWASVMPAAATSGSAASRSR